MTQTHVADLERKASGALATLNPEQTTFARSVADGTPANRAYELAYARPRGDATAETNGSRLLRTHHGVQDAVGQLLDAKRALMAREIVERWGDKAVAKVGELLEADREAVQLKAAQDILDRAGVGEAKRIEIAPAPTPEGVGELREELQERIARVKAMESRLLERTAPGTDSEPTDSRP